MPLSFELPLMFKLLPRSQLPCKFLVAKARKYLCRLLEVLYHHPFDAIPIPSLPSACMNSFML